MKTAKKRQPSVKQMVLGAILFGFFAGFHTAFGIEYLIRQRTEYRWLGSFAMAFGLCAVAAKYGLMLLKNSTDTEKE